MYDIDVIIPAHEKDIDTLDICIEGVKNNVAGVKNVYVISKDKLTDKAIWFPEEKLPFSLDHIAERIGRHWRTGWYFADLLEGCAAAIVDGPSDYTLILDSDTIFIRPVSLIDPNGVCLLNSSPTDGTEAYYEWVSRLIPGLLPLNSESGVTHWIIQKNSIVRDMMELVQSLYGKPFWEAALDVVNERFVYTHDNNPKTGPGKMACFELYFCYALKYHPSKVRVRKLNSVFGYKESLGVPGYKYEDRSRTSHAKSHSLLDENEKSKLSFTSIPDAIPHICNILSKKDWDVVTFQNHTRIGTKEHVEINRQYALKNIL
jgi:hypothetical protein